MFKKMWAVLAGVFFLAAPAQSESVLKSEKVAEGIYALIGPTGARLPENFGLNANFGVVDTAQGAILIDSGPSIEAARLLESEVRRLTGKPVRWVLNTGSQDHRWLGNAYFQGKGAEIIALEKTAATQGRVGAGQLESLERVLGPQMADTHPVQSGTPLPGALASLNLGGRRIELRHFGNAHFPGDAVVWLPDAGIAFSGDLIYVDRILGILPESNAVAWLSAFEQFMALSPRRIVPGHGSVCDAAKARQDTGDYLAFVVAGVKPYAEDMAGVETAVAKLADAPRFRRLANFGDLHRRNVSQAYLRLEAGQ